jgi:type I restriction enzyme S subunit
MRRSIERKMLAPWAETLPTGWKVSRLDAVADVLFSNVDKHTIEGEIPIRLCNYVDVYKNDRITNTIDFMEASAELREINKFQIRCGDVLATKDSEEPDDIAIPALVTDDLPGVLCGYHLALIRSRVVRVDGVFLAWLHASKAYRAQYEAKAVGVTRFGLSQYAFRVALTPLPPLPEQERVAAYLNASCAAIDKVIEIKKEQLTILDELRKSIIHNAVTKGLDDSVELLDSGIDWIGKIPKGWRKEKLFRMCRLVSSGGTPSTFEQDYYDGEIIWVQTGDLNDGYIEKTEKTITQSGLDSSSAKLFPKGTLIIALYGATIGKLGILTRESATNQACCAMIFNPWMHNKFFYYLFFDYRNILISRGYGGGQNNISQETIKQTYFYYPRFEEQKRVANYLDEECARISGLRDNIENQIGTLELYRKSLIHECVTGKWRITEDDLKELANV